MRRRWLRGLHGLSMLAMTLMVGGIGAEYMEAGDRVVGLMLLIPFFALVGLTWGTFSGAAWAARHYVLSFTLAGTVTVGLYLVKHLDFVKDQLAARTLPTLVWLALFFAAWPIVGFVLRNLQEPDTPLGDFLLDVHDE